MTCSYESIPRKERAERQYRKALKRHMITQKRRHLDVYAGISAKNSHKMIKNIQIYNNILDIFFWEETWILIIIGLPDSTRWETHGCIKDRMFWVKFKFEEIRIHNAIPHNEITCQPDMLLSILSLSLSLDKVIGTVLLPLFFQWSTVYEWNEIMQQNSNLTSLILQINRIHAALYHRIVNKISPPLFNAFAPWQSCLFLKKRRE